MIMNIQYIKRHFSAGCSLRAAFPFRGQISGLPSSVFWGNPFPSRQFYRIFGQNTGLYEDLD